jgi:thioredoxin 1
MAMGLFNKSTSNNNGGDHGDSLVHHVSDSELDDLISKDLPVLVDFWAPWCAPCRMIAPALENMAKDYDGKAIIAKVNVDDHQVWASKLGVRGIPTLAIFQGGEPVNQLVGLRPEDELRSELEKYFVTETN